MIAHTNRHEISALADVEFQPDNRAFFLPGPGDGVLILPPVGSFVDQPLFSARSVEISTLPAQAAETPAQARPFPPGPDSAELSLLAELRDADRTALQAVYQTFLTLDDPYLEAVELDELAERLDLNETRLADSLERLGHQGLVRLARAKDGVNIALAESTARGMEAFCRGFRADHADLLRAVGQRVATGAVTDGLTLHMAFPAEPGLLLTHAVETLAADGWLESTEQFGGSCGFQIARVSPGLRAWAESEAAATPWSGARTPVSAAA